ncbi:hypothetical protein KY289_026847 [Solanum tuberosum]|nr:hypothetical protein KY289_026847 [Solanum tuberosum]
MDTYPLTTHYDIIEDLVTDAFEANEKENYVIVLSSDIEVVASPSKDPSHKLKCDNLGYFRDLKACGLAVMPQLKTRNPHR